MDVEGGEIDDAGATPVDAIVVASPLPKEEKEKEKEKGKANMKEMEKVGGERPRRAVKRGRAKVEEKEKPKEKIKTRANSTSGKMEVDKEMEKESEEDADDEDFRGGEEGGGPRKSRKLDHPPTSQKASIPIMTCKYCGMGHLSVDALNVHLNEKHVLEEEKAKKASLVLKDLPKETPVLATNLTFPSSSPHNDLKMFRSEASPLPKEEITIRNNELFHLDEKLLSMVAPSGWSAPPVTSPPPKKIPELINTSAAEIQSRKESALKSLEAAQNSLQKHGGYTTRHSVAADQNYLAPRTTEKRVIMTLPTRSSVTAPPTAPLAATPGAPHPSKPSEGSPADVVISSHATEKAKPLSPPMKAAPSSTLPSSNHRPAPARASCNLCSAEFTEHNLKWVHMRYSHNVDLNKLAEMLWSTLSPSTQGNIQVPPTLPSPPPSHHPIPSSATFTPPFPPLPSLPSLPSLSSMTTPTSNPLDRLPKPPTLRINLPPPSLPTGMPPPSSSPSSPKASETEHK